MKKNLIYLTLIFAVTRIVIDLKIPFWYDTINVYMQYLDPQILSHQLIQGIWYLNSQPPLFNLFLGLVLHIQSVNVQIWGAGELFIL